MNATRAVFFWIAVALAALFLCGIFLFKQEKRKKFIKVSGIVAFGYAGIVAITLLVLGFLKDGICVLLFVPFLLFVVAILGSALLLFFRRNRLTYGVAGFSVGATLLAALIATTVYYARYVEGDGYFNSDTASVNQLVLALGALLLFAVILVLGFFLSRKDTRELDSKSIAYAAVCVALSFALSYLRLWRMPQGGSVTAASLLPLMIYSYMFGTKKGIFAGFAYGILQAFQGLDNVIHPAQLLIDFPIAFSAIGLAGAFADVRLLEKLPQLQFAIGALMASVFRFTAHLLSGVFAFGAYAEGSNPWIYSLLYNSYVFVDIAIVIAVGIAVFSSRAFVREARKFRTKPLPAAQSTPQE